MIKEIVRDEVELKNGSAEFDFENPQTDIIQLSHDLAETMMSNKTMALAGVEIGEAYNVLALLTNPIIVMVNPDIVGTGKLVLMEEGSVTHPGLIIKVKRYDWIRVRFKRPNGEVVTERFEGITSRLIQQKIDLMWGMLFYQNTSKYHRDQAFRRWKNGR